MKVKLLPTQSYEYPFYMALYWILIWAIASFFLYQTITKSSENGMIYKKDCIKAVSNVCVVESRLYKVPVTNELQIQLVSAAIITGGFVIIFGFGQMLLLKLKK